MSEVKYLLKEYPGYLITKSGDIFSKPNKTRSTLRKLSSYKGYYGYSVVGIRVDGKQKTVKIHRLLAQTFIPNPDKLPFVNHIDENTSNNALSNLEWCTPKYNSNYSVASTYKKYGGVWHNAKLSLDDAIEIRRIYESGVARFKDLADLFGVSVSLIDKVIRRERWCE